MGLHQICHWLTRSLGQALQTLVHGAIHRDGEIQLRSLSEELASDRV